MSDRDNRVHFDMLTEATGVVVAFRAPAGEPIRAHELSVIGTVARAIARLKGFSFREDVAGVTNKAGNHYFVPDDSLLAADAARLGIRGPEHLYGGVVPWHFVKTKAITHPLLDGSADRPNGWRSQFGEATCMAVLPGYTVFSRSDALRAAERLLRRGPVRLKPPLLSRGSGQVVATTFRDFERLMERFSSSDLEACGLVLETNIHAIITLSVGITRINEIEVGYHGTQTTTLDNKGQAVYGASHLNVLRGGWRALQNSDHPLTLELAVEQAQAYDAAMANYPGFFASRRKYDVGQGIDSSGIWRSGVLEASWRVGGSSSAELAAIELMNADPEIRTVRVSAVKQYGKDCRPPEAADIHFQGDDPEEGLITRYTVVLQAKRRLPGQSFSS
ncbi:DUF3182 family protein [Mesorhizobium opportunistum]|uniref:Biotin carboxylase n=1 Tax=Mesorhizobium opportunistum (strain LMG 24607 / HAMBI 3007 / WSM2075) TaxID=536019 RepID=F7Y7M4_MESOW|nr:DUF3182 family protein [Mesorhizobium opportunistum]AEH90897.1 biotin carboxylase [Mesorhizobium opportunistum WSM2075]